MGDITVGVIVEGTLGSDVPFELGGIFSEVLDVCAGATLDSGAPFDIFCTFGNVGGIICCRIAAISMNALRCRLHMLGIELVNFVIVRSQSYLTRLVVNMCRL